MGKKVAVLVVTLLFAVAAVVAQEGAKGKKKSKGKDSGAAPAAAAEGAISKPYKGKAHAIPGRIELEDYDEGGRVFRSLTSRRRTSTRSTVMTMWI